MKNKLNLPSKIHFIGIGGAGMNPLAGICLKAGIKVTGSDSTPNKNQDELRALGADIWTPHSAEELAERELPDICVYSTAIPDNNPEVIYLKEKGVQFWHRSDLLEKIANNFEKQIVIAGTHGKTTTTAMLVWILEKAGLKPCWVLGGVLKGLGSYGWSEQREIFVFEGDESDQSFLKSKPYIGLVTSLEPDHLENYNNSFEEQIKKFGEFADKCENFICHENIQKYFSINNLQTYKYSTLLKDKLQISGEHNYLNALGALSIINNLNIKNTKTFFEQAIDYLKDFSGIYRRFEIIGTTQYNITVIDDYAHHPAEIRAVISSAKQAAKGKIYAVVQPHRYSRLKDLFVEFVDCFEGCEQVFVSPVYTAGEAPNGVTAEDLANSIAEKGILVRYFECPSSLTGFLTPFLEPGDMILCMGAGSITAWAIDLVRDLEQSFQPALKAVNENIL